MVYYYTICILFTFLAMLYNTARIPMQNAPIQTAPIQTAPMDLDAKLQRSIEKQVLAGVRQERAMYYSLDQSMLYKQKRVAKAQQEMMAAYGRYMEHLELCNQLSRFSLNMS